MTMTTHSHKAWTNKGGYVMHCPPNAESAKCDARYNSFLYISTSFPQNVLITRFVLLVRSGTDLTALHAKTGRWFFWNDAGRVLGR